MTETCMYCLHSMSAHTKEGSNYVCSICACASINLHIQQQTTHYDTDKPGVDQIYVPFLEELGRVFKYGERKYARDNWKTGTDWWRFYGSMLRHAFAFWKGESNDPESGCHHLAHAAWNCMALYYYWYEGKGNDTRD